MKIKNTAFITESHNNGSQRYWYVIDVEDFEYYMSSGAQDTSLLYHIHDTDNGDKYYNKDGEKIWLTTEELNNQIPPTYKA